MGPISLGCTCRTRSTQADESANYARGGLAVSRSYPCLLWSTQYCCGALHRVADKLPIRWEGALFGTNVAEFWRPATDNDLVGLLSSFKHGAKFFLAMGVVRLQEAPNISTSHERVDISVRAKMLPAPDDTELEIHYTVTPVPILSLLPLSPWELYHDYSWQHGTEMFRLGIIWMQEKSSKPDGTILVNGNGWCFKKEEDGYLFTCGAYW